MLDLCAGLGGASQAMKSGGWQVFTVDVDPRFNPDIVADIREFSWNGQRPDLVWASPPCTEFSRESMPWCRTGQAPDMSIVLACLRIIRECNPPYWVIENVRGAIRHFRPILGPPRSSFGPFFLWGVFPIRGHHPIEYKPKESYSGKRSDLRAKVPAEVSLAVLDSIVKTPYLTGLELC